METKHVIFFIFLFLGVPFLTLLWYSSKQAQKIGVFLLIFSIPFNEVAGINFFTDPSYRGTSRGFEVTLTDLIVTSILFFLYIKNKKIILFPKGSIFYIIYLITSLISIMNSEFRIHSGWEAQKMLLMYLFFITLYNYIIYKKNINIIINSLCFLVIFNFIIILNQKYLIGYYQPSGLFAHRNSTSMFINLIAPIFLSLLLNSKTKKSFFYLFVFSICAISVIFALSRGAIFFFPIAATIVASFSIASKITNRKIQIIALFLVLAILGTLKSAPMIADRFERASAASGETRIRLAKIAVRMANDNFFGIGLNNWGIKVNPPFTYSEGLRPWEDEEYKDGIVETIYLLVAAECGWIGFTSLLFWFGYYLFQNVLNIRRYKNSLSVYLPIGILAGLIAIFGQSTLEWVLKQTPNFYELMLIFAIVAAMAKLYEDNKKSKKVI